MDENELTKGELYKFELESANGFAAFRCTVDYTKNSPHTLIIGDVYSDMRGLLWEQSVEVITVLSAPPEVEHVGETIVINSMDSLSKMLDRIMEIVTENAEIVVDKGVSTVYELDMPPVVVQWDITEYMSGCTQEIRDKLIKIIKLGRSTGICLTIKCPRKELLTWLFTDDMLSCFNEISVISNTGAVFAVQATTRC